MTNVKDKLKQALTQATTNGEIKLEVNPMTLSAFINGVEFTIAEQTELALISGGDIQGFARKMAREVAEDVAKAKEPSVEDVFEKAVADEKDKEIARLKAEIEQLKAGNDTNKVAFPDDFAEIFDFAEADEDDIQDAINDLVDVEIDPYSYRIVQQGNFVVIKFNTGDDIQYLVAEDYFIASMEEINSRKK